MSIPLQLRVITVDDSELIADRLKCMLEEIESVSILGNATNIAGALVLIGESRPHVMILDINLKEDAPLGTGMSLISPLRKSYPHLYIIMLTNLSAEYYKTKCIELGADYFLDKTHDFEKIPSILAEIAATKKLPNISGGRSD